MSSPLTLLFIVSLSEIALLVVILVFFLRLRRSEAMLSNLQEKQELLLRKLHFNTELEQELVTSFEHRQTELSRLDQVLEMRANDLTKLIKQAEDISRSPHFLREVILTGARQGKSPQALALSTGLSVDEVQLILQQSEG